MLGVYATYTLESHSPTDSLDVHPLALGEPPRTHCRSDRNLQARLIFDLELRNPSLRADSRACKMTQHWPCNIPGFFLPSANLNSPVAVLLSPLVCDDFVAIELQDCACCTLSSLGVVHGCHTAFVGEETGAQRCTVGFSLEGRSRCAVQCGLGGVVSEAVGSGLECRLDGTD